MEAYDTVDEIGRRILVTVKFDPPAEDKLSCSKPVQPYVCGIDYRVDKTSGDRIIHLLPERKY